MLCLELQQRNNHEYCINSMLSSLLLDESNFFAEKIPFNISDISNNALSPFITKHPHVMQSGTGSSCLHISLALPKSPVQQIFR